MELFAKVAHEQNAGVIVVTHDERTLEVFDTIYEMEDGVIRPGAGHMRHSLPASATQS
jgi:putative ABC transport system ATP-binding protein